MNLTIERKQPYADTNGNALIPGCLYVEQFTNHYGDGQNLYERLFWYGGDGRCYDADSGDEIYPDGDTCVRQLGAFNNDYAALAA